jgi:hypothetical protein
MPGNAGIPRLHGADAIRWLTGFCRALALTAPNWHHGGLFVFNRIQEG